MSPSNSDTKVTDILEETSVPFDGRDTVLICGSGRSGTTWISNIINYRNTFRYIFEPFRAATVPCAAPFGYQPYVSPDSRDERYLEPARLLLSGKIHHPWIDQFDANRDSAKRLVKDIRINLMLKWLSVNFPLMPIILVLRHPCAVARSKMKMGWPANLIRMVEQNAGLLEYLSPFMPVIEKANDPFEQQIVFWCIQNYIPLRQFQRNELTLVFYERLCLEPEVQVPALLEAAGEPYAPEALAAGAVPSRLSKPHSAILTGGNLLEGWRKDVSQDQIERAKRLLGQFGLDRFYDERSMPVFVPNMDCKTFL